ncbi:cytochrome P450 [Xylariaceae sp. FL1019]|nr:cytochrome P450 [Xylariaceae sp. FL1019]
MAFNLIQGLVALIWWLVVPALLTRYVWELLRLRQEERIFAAKNGCKTPKAWNARWPLGLDMFFKALSAAKEGRVLKLFLNIVDENGHTFVQHLFAVPGIDTMDPENIETVLSTNFADYDLGLRPMTFHALLGDGIFTQDGANWKASRQLLRPQFASNRAQNFTEIQECVERLVHQISAQGPVVDLQPLFFRLTFETTMFLLFGEHANELKGVTEQESTFADAFNLAQDYLAHRGRLGHMYWLFNNKEFRGACKTCHDFIDKAVGKTLETTKLKIGENEDEGNYIFIEALVRQTRNPIVLRDQCLNVLLAGRDTTGCCLSWTFRLLARHQQALLRLRREVDSVVGLGVDATPPSRDDLKRMPYLAMVLKEVLRLYPSVPVNSRSAISPTVLPTGGGPDGKSPIFVAKGRAVGYCVYAMHRRKDIYGPDAEKFRPERWEGDELKHIHSYAYLPFNGGPRMSRPLNADRMGLEEEFALLEASYTVARLLQLYPHIAVPVAEAPIDVGDEQQNLTLVVSCAEGCTVFLSP